MQKLAGKLGSRTKLMITPLLNSVTPVGGGNEYTAPKSIYHIKYLPIISSI